MTTASTMPFRRTVCALGAGFLVSCCPARSVAVLEPTQSIAESIWRAGSPVLGFDFGSLVTVEAEAIVHEPRKGGAESVLHVSRINGTAAGGSIRIPWTYGGWHAERAEPAGRDGFRIRPGVVYRLRGYEAGSWVGVPNVIVDVLVDEFGPPQAKSLYFRSVFRVIDGEPLKR